MILNRRVRVEFDSVEERTHSLHDGYHYPGHHYVVKLRIYNRGLFRLNGEISSMFGKPLSRSERRTSGCLIPREWSEPVSIDLPGRRTRLQNIFRNPSRSETLEPDFFIYEIRTLVPKRLLTLYIDSTCTIFNQRFGIPKYFRRFRLALTARMLEQERKLAESKTEANSEYIDGMETRPVPDEILATLMSDPLYALEEIEENFKNAF